MIRKLIYRLMMIQQGPKITCPRCGSEMRGSCSNCGYGD